MLRRPFQSRPPCIRGVGRQASSHARNQKVRVTAVQALAHSLVVHGLTGGAKSAQNLLDRKTIQIIDPRTREEVTIDLQTVQPFTPEFALLPLRYRTAVERRHLLATLRERQKTAYEVESPEENDNDKLKPDDELVKKYISEFLKRRRATTDTPPSDSKINQYIEAAQEKALKEGRERISTRKAQDPSEDEISFEEQWNRRQTYGENIIKPLTPQSIARYSPTRDLKNPVKPRNVTIEQLLAAGSHIGHNKSSCHPAMKPFISGLHDSTHIINLDYTLAHLRRACTIVREVTFRQGIILIIGTRKGHKPILINATERMGACMLSKKWIPGTLTNGQNVLYRGYVRDEPTPFRPYAKDKGEKGPEDLPPELQGGDKKLAFVWGRETNSWIPSEEEGSVDSKTTNLVPTNEPLNRMAITPNPEGWMPNLAGWMAWDKFTSIVQDVTGLSTDIATAAQQSLQTTLAINSEYIPDHRDNWYIRKLRSEYSNYRMGKIIEGETGDRNPLERLKMDRFLAQKGFIARGQYPPQIMERLQSGFAAYPRVKAFRDGSTMLGEQRFDKHGRRFLQYPDGSYMVNDRLYDREGKRYDRKRRSLLFSDGSELKFVGKGRDRKLVVGIGDKTFDVTSTVSESAQKRDIIQRAEEYFQPQGESTPAQQLDHPTESVKSDTLPQAEEKEPWMQEEEEEDQDDDEFYTGSEILEGSDDFDAKQMDELVQRSSRMNNQREELAQTQPELRSADPNPFDNLFSRPTSTVRPELLIVLNPRENRLALREAANHQVPTIGIIDTDSDPRSVTYSIPANDDSLRSVEYITGVLSRAGEEGLIHRQRYAEQLDTQIERATELGSKSRQDYNVLSREAGEADPEVRKVSAKYCKWYGLDQEETELTTLKKMAAQHIKLAQDEIARLRSDTTGWTMQDYLDRLKTNTQFPGMPEAVLQEMAQVQLAKSREAWAESREKVKLRDINYAPERFQGRVDIE